MARTARKNSQLKAVNIRIEVSEAELNEINLRTTPRQRALILAAAAERIKAAEIEAAMRYADALTDRGLNSPLGLDET